jgi:hypothetical protein
MSFCIGINRVKDAIEEISLRQLDPEASELSVRDLVQRQKRPSTEAKEN